MIVLNLSSLRDSQLKYEVKKRSDGQQDVIIDKANMLCGITEIGKTWSLGVTIKSRFNSFQDLEVIIGATKSLRRMGVEEIHLFIPYLLGARGDRQFEKGGNSYLVDVVAPIINLQNYKSVTVMDVHSDVAAACITNLKVVGNSVLLSRALNSLTVMNGKPYDLNEVILCSPDAGALKKIYQAAESIKYTGDIMVATKHRNTVTNEVEKTSVNYKNSYANKDIIIIDDICDGGRTFIEIAKAIKADSKHQGKLVLVVTHGIFSYGVSPVLDFFNLIVTSNSVKDYEDMIVNERRTDVSSLKVINFI
jgi:ribose-phosphate pyrophosphokinase